MRESEGYQTQIQALLAARRADLAGIRVQLDLLSDDELIVLRGVLWDVATELRFTLTDRGCDLSGLPRCDVSRDDWWSGVRRCPAPDCGRLLTSARSHYCSGRCRMRAFRERRFLDSQPTALTAPAPTARRPVDHCVYECTNCGERFLGERRCPQCNLFNRNLGLGEPCPDCDRPIVLAELLDSLAASNLPRTPAGRR